MNKNTLVSVIIRTCNRPEILKRAIESVKAQTYKNIEMVIIEDGANSAEAMLQKDYSGLNIRYYCTGINKGRSVAGNIGLDHAAGKYVNFLDDDDQLYPKHVETLVTALGQAGNSEKAAYSLAEECQIKVVSKQPYHFQEKRKFIRYKQPYSRSLLFSFNFIPIQSILFERALYEEKGGFDTTLDLLEDWDLWVRYATVTDFIYVPEATSVYYTPYKSASKKQRDIEMNKALPVLYKKFETYQISLNVRQINLDMDYVLTIYNKKGLFFVMRKIRNFLLYHEH